MKNFFTLLFFALCFCAQTMAADDAEKDSATQLLEQLLRDPVPTSSPQPPQQGMSVKVYQLGNIRVDAPNGIRAVDVLRKWLPSGSNVTPVPATNSLHVLTTDSAHASLSELLAALDQPVGAPTPAVDPQLKEAFEHFAANSIDPDAMKRIVHDVVQQNATLLQDAEAKISGRIAQDQRRFYVIAGVFCAAVLLILLLLLIRTKKKETTSTALVPVSDKALTVIGQQIQQSHGTLAVEVKKMLETALQIQRQGEAQKSAEYASLKTQMEIYLGKHTALIEESRRTMEHTTERLNLSAESIKASQEKNEKLTDRLRELFGEVDRLNQALADKDDRLDAQAEELKRKEEEVSEVRNRLAQNMAKVALLAKELGASEDFLNTPLPAFDQFVEGGDSVPPTGPVPDDAGEATEDPEADMPSAPEGDLTPTVAIDRSSNEDPHAIDDKSRFEFGDPV